MKWYEGVYLYLSRLYLTLPTLSVMQKANSLKASAGGKCKGWAWRQSVRCSRLSHWLIAASLMKPLPVVGTPPTQPPTHTYLTPCLYFLSFSSTIDSYLIFIVNILLARKLSIFFSLCMFIIQVGDTLTGQSLTIFINLYHVCHSIITINLSSSHCLTNTTISNPFLYVQCDFFSAPNPPPMFPFVIQCLSNH